MRYIVEAYFTYGGTQVVEFPSLHTLDKWAAERNAEFIHPHPHGWIDTFHPAIAGLAPGESVCAATCPTAYVHCKE